MGVGGKRVKRREGDAGTPHACVPAYHDPSWQERTNPVLSTRIPTHSTRAHTCAHVHTDVHHRFRPLTLGPTPPHRSNHPPPACSSKPTTHTHPTLTLPLPSIVPRPSLWKIWIWVRYQPPCPNEPLMWPISSFPPLVDVKQLFPSLSRSCPRPLLSFFILACVSLWRTHVSNFLPRSLSLSLCSSYLFPAAKRRTVLRVVVTAEFVGTIALRLVITMLSDTYRPLRRY